MEFDKRKIYSWANADELHVGDKVIYSDAVGYLKELVEQNTKPGIILEIGNDSSSFRFGVSQNYTKQWYAFAYLVERAKNCTNCKGCIACIKPDKTFVCEDWKPKTKRNLCDSCKHCFADCPATPDDVKFGDGMGNDNVYECDKYEKKEKHFRPFRDTDELVKVWKEKSKQVHSDYSLTMPYIWVRRKESNSKGQLITEFSNTFWVRMGKEEYNMTDLLVYFTFLDGSPCGVEE